MAKGSSSHDFLKNVNDLLLFLVGGLFPEGVGSCEDGGIFWLFILTFFFHPHMVLCMHNVRIK